VHVSRGVATHGFAVNVDNDLAPFSWIVACGLPGVEMTSIARELGGEVSPERFRARVARCFCAAHGARARPVSPQQLGLTGASKSQASSAGRTPAARGPVDESARADDPPLPPPPAPALRRGRQVVGV
jgi:hypothetical protein